jgi:hypothetical protein
MVMKILIIVFIITMRAWFIQKDQHALDLGMLVSVQDYYALEVYVDLYLPATDLM